MPDLSALGIRITSNGVVKTTNELTAFSKAASAARTAARSPINVRVGNTGIARALSDIQKLDRALRSMGGRGGASSARLSVTGGAAAVREINRFAKAVTDARRSVGSGITVQLRANGSQSAVRGIHEYQKAVTQAQSAASKGANFNMGGGGGLAASTGSATTSIIGLSRAVLGLAGAFGVLRAGQFFAKIADESNLIAARLKLATAENGNFAQAMIDVRRIAAESRSDLDVTATLYQRLMITSKELGFAQSDVAKFTETVGKSFKVSGANAIEASNATRQLIQAIQSGVLRGDEFRSIMEQAPRLAQAIAEGMGTTVNKLRELAEDGKLVTEEVFNSVLKSYEAINKQFDELPVTFGDAMGQIYNAAVITFGAFDEGGEFSKAITSFLIGGSNGMNDMEASAKQMGSSFRAEIDGLVSVFGPLIKSIDDTTSAISRAIDALGNVKPASRGFISDALGIIDGAANSASWVMNQIGRGRRAVFGGPTINYGYTDLQGAFDTGRDESLLASKWRDIMSADPRTQYLSQGGVLPEETIKKSTSALAENNKEKDKSAKAAERLAERLKREREATEALIAGNYAVVAAYGESTAAALHAGIVAKATADGTKRQADIEAYVAQQTRKAVSERIRSSAESIAKMEDETNAQANLNKSIIMGTVNIENASDELAKLNQRRELLNTIELAKTFTKDAKAIHVAEQALVSFDSAQEKSIAIRKEWEAVQSLSETGRKTDLLREEIMLQYEVGKARISAMRGLNGEALDERMAVLNSQYEKSVIVTRASAETEELRKKKMEGTTAEVLRANAAIEASIDALWDNVEAQKAQIDLALKFENEARAARMLTEEVNALIGAMGGLSGVGGQLGGLIGALSSSNPQAALMGMGGLGSIAGLLTGGGGAVMRAGMGIESGLNQLGLGKLLGGNTTAALGSALAGAGFGSMIGGTVGGLVGSKKGGNIGGMVGGAALGPIGAIAGSLLGGLVGGMFSKTRSGSATFNGGSYTVSGNSESRERAAAGLADSVLGALDQIADAFGADIGSFSSAIGVRKGDIRFNPTGGALKNGINFGEDSAAALKAAVADAISDGVFTGLSAGVERLLKGEGDIEKQLQKALTFQGVIDEYDRAKNPLEFDLRKLDDDQAKIKAIFDEAGASAEEYAKLEWSYGEKRNKIIADANRQAMELEQQRGDLQIALLGAQGRGEEALALQRQEQIEALDESLRPLQEQINAEMDLAAIRAQAAERASEEADLTIRLLQAQGREEEALVLSRQRQLDGMPEYLRAMQEMINLAEDLAAAVAKARGIFSSQTSLEQEILNLESQLTGDQEKALMALKLAREDELRAAEASLRPLLMRKYALEDEVAAMEKQQAISGEIAGLNRQWLELIGDTATIRSMMLADLQSDEARELQQRIWDYTDALAAQAEATRAAEEAEKARMDAINDARNVLSQAYERESSALQGTIDKFRDFASTIAEFRQGLRASEDPIIAFNQAQRTFQSTARMAQFGNEKALGAFTGDAQRYLDAARARSGSLAEYQGFVAEVAKASRMAESGASGLASEAETRLREIQAMVEPFIDLIGERAVGVEEALERLINLQSQDTPVVAETLQEGFAKLEIKADEQMSLDKETSEDAKAMGIALMSRIVNIESYLRTAHRGNGFNIMTDDALPMRPVSTVSVKFETTPTVNANVTNNPLPVDQV